MLPGMARHPQLLSWTTCRSCDFACPTAFYIRPREKCVCGGTLLDGPPSPAEGRRSCNLHLWSKCTSCHQAVCGPPAPDPSQHLGVACPHASCQGVLLSLSAMPPHLLTPPPSIMELAWSPLATLPCRVPFPRPLELQEDGTMWLPRSPLHNGMFYCAVCRRAFSSADAALALGLLICCGQAIRPVPMASQRGDPRPPVATCA